MESFIPPTVIVGQEIAGRSEEVRKKLDTLLFSLNKNTFDIGDLLYEVKTNGYFNKWGFESFSKYLEELDIKASKAHYLVRIVDVMKQLGIERETYEPLGLSKLREITSLNPDDTYVNPNTQAETPMKEFIEGFVEKGTDMELSDIRNHVRTLKGLVGENDLVWLNFSVQKIVKEQTIQPALDLAKLQLGTSGYDDEGKAIDASDGKAIEVICTEFLNDPANQYIGEQQQHFAGVEPVLEPEE